MKGMIALRKLLALFLALLLLSGCSAVSPAAELPEDTVAPLTQPTTEPPTTAPPETTRPVPDWEILSTPNSTCFTIISYCEATMELKVQFRESGAWYVYYDVGPMTWAVFKRADSKGGYFNEYIKGNYEYKRLN